MFKSPFGHKYCSDNLYFQMFDLLLNSHTVWESAQSRQGRRGACRDPRAVTDLHQHRSAQEYLPILSSAHLTKEHASSKKKKRKKGKKKLYSSTRTSGQLGSITSSLQPETR